MPLEWDEAWEHLRNWLAETKSRGETIDHDAVLNKMEELEERVV